MPRHFCVWLDLVICLLPCASLQSTAPLLSCCPLLVDLGHLGLQLWPAPPYRHHPPPPTRATLDPRGITLEVIVRL